MAFGQIKINTTMGYGTIPVPNVNYSIKDKNGATLFSGTTNANGESGIYTLTAPSGDLTMEPNPNIRPYGMYDVVISKPGFATLRFIDVEVFEGQLSVQPADMIPVTDGNEQEHTIVIPPPTAALPTYQRPPDSIPSPEVQARSLALQATMADPIRAIGRPVVIPDFITVHLGTPANTNAPNVRVPFIDYVKNVTSSEIYPTWPVNSLIANIHCIVSFALNRIYTEWYPSRGRNFDITSSTTVDQAFVPGRTIFQNISQIVDGIFNVYARRQGFQNPFFTQYCNGTTSTCPGLSQWGTVPLAQRGFTPIQILHNFYPRDLILVSAPSGTITQSYPGTPLREGDTGPNVQRIQNQLNRVRANFPAIPVIPNPNGVFGPETTAAVRAMQRTFNLTVDGVVGRATWNRLTQLWVAVTSLAELVSEGDRIGLGQNPPTVVIRQGNRGANVIHAQFLLRFISNFYPDIPAPIMDSIFGPATAESVRAFQRHFGLTADGIVGPITWRKLYEVYRRLENEVPQSPGVVPPLPPTPPQPPTPPPTTWPPYPGFFIRRGSRGNEVRTVQEMINNSRTLYSAVPSLVVDGIFGPLTENSVRVFQLHAGLGVDGIVGPLTWGALSAIPR